MAMKAQPAHAQACFYGRRTLLMLQCRTAIKDSQHLHVHVRAAGAARLHAPDRKALGLLLSSVMAVKAVCPFLRGPCMRLAMGVLHPPGGSSAVSGFFLLGGVHLMQLHCLELVLQVLLLSSGRTLNTLGRP